MIVDDVGESPAGLVVSVRLADPTEGDDGRGRLVRGDEELGRFVEAEEEDASYTQEAVLSEDGRGILGVSGSGEPKPLAASGERTTAAIAPSI